MQTLNNWLLLKPVTEMVIKLGGKDFYLEYGAGMGKKTGQELHLPKCEMVEVVAMPERFKNELIVGENCGTTLSMDDRYQGMDFSQPEFRVGAKLIASKGLIDLSMKSDLCMMGYQLHRNLEPAVKYFFERYSPLRNFLCAVDEDGIRPLGYNVIAEPIEEESQSEIVVTVSKTPTDKSRVVHPGKCHWLKKGDVVVTQKYSHYQISTGTEYYLCFDGVVDVVGVLKNLVNN